MREPHPSTITGGVPNILSYPTIFFSLGVHAVFGDRISTLSGLFVCRPAFGCPTMPHNFWFVPPAPGSGGNFYEEQKNRQCENPVAGLRNRSRRMREGRLSVVLTVFMRSNTLGASYAAVSRDGALHRERRPTGTGRRTRRAAQGYADGVAGDSRDFFSNVQWVKTA